MRRKLLMKAYYEAHLKSRPASKFQDRSWRQNKKTIKTYEMISRRNYDWQDYFARLSPSLGNSPKDFFPLFSLFILSDLKLDGGSWFSRLKGHVRKRGKKEAQCQIKRGIIIDKKRRKKKGKESDDCRWRKRTSVGGRNSGKLVQGPIKLTLVWLDLLAWI